MKRTTKRIAAALLVMLLAAGVAPAGWLAAPGQQEYGNSNDPYSAMYESSGIVMAQLQIAESRIADEALRAAEYEYRTSPEGSGSYIKVNLNERGNSPMPQRAPDAAREQWIATLAPQIEAELRERHRALLDNIYQQSRYIVSYKTQDDNATYDITSLRCPPLLSEAKVGVNIPQQAASISPASVETL